MRTFPVSVGISNRHLHLSQAIINELFGDQGLTKKKDLSQPGQYACEETVTLIGPKGRIEGVRILGPARAEAQVEVSFTDAIRLGLTLPVRDSGSLEGTPGISISAGDKIITLDRGVIAAKRHIHLSEEEAALYGLKDKDIVKVRADTPRGGIFHDVLVRVNPNFSMDFHIDTDEANAFGLKNGDIVTVILD